MMAMFGARCVDECQRFAAFVPHATKRPETSGHPLAVLERKYCRVNCCPAVNLASLCGRSVLVVVVASVLLNVLTNAGSFRRSSRNRCNSIAPSGPWSHLSSK